jgi:outer membrane receptor for ferrienterochelin and colicin
MIKPDVTSSQRNLTRDVLVTLPGVDNFSQALEKNTSAVGTGRQIHIRGGRTGEVSYMVDGLSIKDPLASGSFGMMVGTNSISEMSTILGGFNAEYGQAQSGIVNMVTKEGSARFTGNVAYRTDRVPGTTREEHRFLNFDRAEVSGGGPEFLTNSLLRALRLPGRAKYFAATDGEWQDGYGKYISNWQTRYRLAGITLQDRRLNNYTGSLKWTYELSGKKLSLSLRGSQGHSFGARPLGSVEYVYAYRYIPEFAPRVHEYGNQEVLAWTHVISQNTFYTLNLSRFLNASR